MNHQQEQHDCIPGLQLLCLTPEDDYQYNDQEENQEYNWIDDCECQENLATILPLNPEECIVDSENHIQNVDGHRLFFEELGCFTEEPEPIDPSRDYDAEAVAFIEERNKTRKQHVELSYSPMPSLDNTTSGLSSASSSFHHDEQSSFLADIRSPPYLGGYCGQSKTTAYAYAPHAMRAPI
ncbi:hypothetical protein BD408DRAFT_408687 [Parasitella parasitica]|nr:hypothetical protein BD408DRAFT_408687 [Parasitella parasitica]